MNTDREPLPGEVWRSIISTEEVKIKMAWDEKSRYYVCEYVTGPNRGENVVLMRTNLEKLVPETPQTDVPQAGDIYDAVKGDCYYVLLTGPDGEGWCAAERHDSGVVANTVITPSWAKQYRKRVKRPRFPSRDVNTLRLSDSGGMVSAAISFKSAIAYVDFRDIPWRWEDGTLVTDEEKGLTDG